MKNIYNKSFKLKNKNSKKMSNKQNDEIKIKLILLGDSEVGKTSIIKNFFNVGFDEEMVSTTSSQYEEKSNRN